MHSRTNKLLLINPWIYDFTAYDLWSQPLGLLYLASFLRHCGYDISYIDCLADGGDPPARQRRKFGSGNYRREIVEKPPVLEDIPRKFARYGMSEQEFLRQIKESPSPDAVLVTTVMTYWYPGPRHVVELIRQVYPDVPVILGGIYATLMPEHAKQNVKADYIITGPGEQKILALLSELLGNNPAEAFPHDQLDAYPYPAFDLIPELHYLCIMTARGCPFNCSFCAQKQIALPFTQREPQAVVREIKANYQQYRKRDFAFYDDALFINKERHIKEILKGIIQLRSALRFHTPNGLFAGDIDPELAQLLFKANFKTIRLSFETANEQRRKDMFNKISNNEMVSAVQNLQQAGYLAKDLEAYIIMGLPQQTLDEVIESMLFVNNLGVRIKLASYSPIPGTLDFQRAVDAGMIQPDIDPLLTNKTIFPLKNTDLDYDTFRKVRIFGQLLNEGAEKDLRLFGNNAIGRSLKNILEN